MEKSCRSVGGSSPLPVPDSNDEDNDTVDTVPPTSVNVNDSEPHEDRPDVTIPVSPEPRGVKFRPYGRLLLSDF